MPWGNAVAAESFLGHWDPQAQPQLRKLPGWRAAPAASAHPCTQPGALALQLLWGAELRLCQVKGSRGLDLSRDVVPGQAPRNPESLSTVGCRKGLLTGGCWHSFVFGAAPWGKRVIEITNAMQGELGLAGFYRQFGQKLNFITSGFFSCLWSIQTS